MSDGSLIETSSPADGVRLIAFNRPQKRNAMSSELITELLAELAAASKDDTVRAIVLTGSGSFFSGERHKSDYFGTGSLHLPLARQSHLLFLPTASSTYSLV